MAVIRLRGASQKLVDSARELRQQMTPAEEELWRALRMGAVGRRVRRQHPIGASVVDFFIPSAGLAIELDGSVHDVLDVAVHDRERAAWLEAQGIRVIRFQNDEVLNDVTGVVNRIREALA